MTPRKTIMLFCADEDRRREFRFMLRINRYLVVGWNDGVPADCALVIANPISSPNAAYVIRECHPGMPLLVMVCKSEEKYYPIGARFVIVKATTEALLQMLKLSIAANRGKPGPKKGNRCAGAVQESNLITSAVG